MAFVKLIFKSKVEAYCLAVELISLRFKVKHGLNSRRTRSEYPITVFGDEQDGLKGYFADDFITSLEREGVVVKPSWKD